MRPFTHLHTADRLPRDAAARSTGSSVSFESSSVSRRWSPRDTSFLRASSSIHKGRLLQALARTLKGSMRNARLLGAAMACARVPTSANTSSFVAPNTTPFGTSLLPFQTPRSSLSKDRFNPSKQSPIDSEISGSTTMKLGFGS